MQADHCHKESSKMKTRFNKKFDEQTKESKLKLSKQQELYENHIQDNARQANETISIIKDDK